MISRLVRGVAVIAVLAIWTLYLREGLASDDPLRWTNEWLSPAMWSVGGLVVVFVLTFKQAGTRGSPLTNLADMFKRTRIKDPVDGSAQVVSVSSPPRSGQNAGRAMCTMNLVVTVPGQSSVAVDTASLVPLAKWPMPGMALPVIAERNDPQQFKIVWDQVASGWSVGVDQAKRLADQMNSGPHETPTGFPASSSRFVTTNVTINGQPADAEDLAPFEATTGMDLDGDGLIAGNPAGTPNEGGPKAVPLSGDAAKTLLSQFLGAGASQDGLPSDPVSQLERLTELHTSGAITDTEFEAAKKKVLGQ